MTRFIASTLLVLGTTVTGMFAAATPAQATCTQEYYVCLNNNVYPNTGLKATLESIECGLDYWGCLARKL
jgi:hypothetical protein